MPLISLQQREVVTSLASSTLCFRRRERIPSATYLTSLRWPSFITPPCSKGSRRYYSKGQRKIKTCWKSKGKTWTKGWVVWKEWSRDIVHHLLREMGKLKIPREIWQEHILKVEIEKIYSTTIFTLMKGKFQDLSLIRSYKAKMTKFLKIPNHKKPTVVIINLKFQQQ